MHTVKYKGFDITYAYPPIPIRVMDWNYSEDGAEVSSGHAATLEECKRQIDELIEERQLDAEWERENAQAQ